MSEDTREYRMDAIVPEIWRSDFVRELKQYGIHVEKEEVMLDGDRDHLRGVTCGVVPSELIAGVEEIADDYQADTNFWEC